MKLETGGSAFPTIPYATGTGMTLLDYFAGQAMIGEMSGARHTQSAEVLAKRSWEFARAMLAEKRRLEAESKELPKVG